MEKYKSPKVNRKGYRTFSLALIVMFLHFGFVHAPAQTNTTLNAARSKALAIKADDISKTKMASAKLSIPAQPTEKATDIFVPHETPPWPIGGSEAIEKQIVYPELAKKAKIEGSVFVGVFIDEQGNPIKTKVRKGASFRGFEKAVRKALMAVKWQPAKQGERAVKVWVWIPVEFHL